MSGRNPPKTHFYERGKSTKCGRDTTAMSIVVTNKMALVTCQQCISPSRPFTTTNFDRQGTR